ncbi:MAG: hypothetical protein LBU76_10770 [Azoarcus sp.]|nr:hypothetical protein [Azoarcus sp.]
MRLQSLGQFFFSSPLFVSGSTWNHFGLAGTNYIGPGYSSGQIGGTATGSAVQPTNAVDALALEHDIAYEAAETSSTPKRDTLKADLALLKDLSSLMRDDDLPSGEMVLAKVTFASIAGNVLVKNLPDAFAETHGQIDIVGIQQDMGIA